MEKRIVELVDGLVWNKMIIDILINAPNINLEIDVWVKAFQKEVEKFIGQNNMVFNESKNSSQIFKIKSRDQKYPEFNKLPLKEFVEKKSIESYTRSSVHGVKGETYEAVLLHVTAQKGQTLTPKFLNDGDLDSELMRIAYVAMTRPRRLLVVAMPKSNNNVQYTRFPKELWDYEVLN
jgi:superfamily I DNA/RNA helicase